MIREMGNVELFELCETSPKVQCSECLLCWSQGVIYCTCGHLLIESESSQHFNRLRLDSLSIPYYVIKKNRPHGARHGKTEAQRKSILWPTMRGRDVSRRIMKEFTIVSYEIQFFVTRNSKLAGPRRSASQWINWHTKTTPTAYSVRNTWDTKNIGISHWTNRARMHRWDFDQTSEPQLQKWTVSTENQEKNQFLLTVPKVAPIFFQFFMVELEKTWWSSYFYFVVVGSFTADSNLLQPTHTSPFSRALIMLSHTTLAQLFARVISSMCHAPEWLSVLSSTLTLLSLASLSIFHFFFLNLDFYLFLFHVDAFGARSPVHFAQWGGWPFGQ